MTYEYYQLQHQLKSLVNSNVLNLGSKHPDYIYIKYHIYKETMLQKKHEELEGKVRQHGDNHFIILNIFELTKLMLNSFRNG